MSGLSEMKSEDPDLYRDIIRLSKAISDHFDVRAENACTEITHVAVQLLRAKGYDAKHVRTHPENLAFQSDDDADHDWVRVGNWNVDMTLGQFEGAEWLPYPFVTRKDSPLASEVYGSGSKALRGNQYGILKARGPGWPTFRELQTASPSEAWCDLDAFRAVADEFLR